MVALVHEIINLQILKKKKNSLFNGGLDAALEGALYGGLNVALEGGTLEFTLKAFENVQEGDEMDTLDV